MQLRISVVLLALLPALAQGDQIPLKEKAAGWLDKAKSYIPSGVPSIPNPIDAGAAKIAAQKVEKINLRNYARKLGPKLEGEEEWVIYLTGGNKSCYGRCGKADQTWNESVPILAALPKYQDATLRLGFINCEYDEVLCTGWGVGLPSIYHFIFPQKITTTTNPISPPPSSPLHEIRLNLTTIQVSDITSIPRASKSSYLEVEEYTGFMHPVDGWLQKYGLLVPFGYVLWGLGTTPTWMLMIALSFFSRQYVSRRATSRPTSWTNQARPGAAGPAAAGAGAGSGGVRAGAAPGPARKR